MFPFSNNYLSKHKIFFLVLFYITGNNLLSQNINYSAGKISSDANKRLILEQSVKLNIDNIAISTEKLIIDQEKEIGFAKEISFKIEENNFWGEAEELNFSKENVSFQDGILEKEYVLDTHCLNLFMLQNVRVSHCLPKLRFLQYMISFIFVHRLGIIKELFLQSVGCNR